MAYTAPAALWSDALIQRYDLAGPRYTSYPTAPQFNEQFSIEHWQQAVASSNRVGKPLSLYFHIPFCETVCYYCGCNKIITADKNKSERYVQALLKEIDLQAQYVNTNRPVKQLHWGGGTPTYLSDAQMQTLMRHTASTFNLIDDDQGEYALEIHPQSASPERLELLRALGFNRLSIGIQDFNSEVQKAVNRFNTQEEVSALITAARQLNYRSVSVDLIYGLPKQTLTGFMQTLNQVIAMRPDRLSLFNYAHMPHLFKVQKQINEADLPAATIKLQILHSAIDQLLSEGYQYIGMDHFALPEDELSQAQNSGHLHRNFQGYATNGDCDLLGFGVSSINSVNNTYAQNIKTLDAYYDKIENNQLPLLKGYALNTDDQIRRAVIKELACHFSLNFAALEKSWAIEFETYFKQELAELEPMMTDGLLKRTEQGIEVLTAGRLLVRRVCMVFDAYLKNTTQVIATSIPRYSKII